MCRSVVLESIYSCGIVPAVRVDNQHQALAAVEGLRDGGIHVAEVAMSMPNAMSVLSETIRTFSPGMIIGAGTVLDAETARRCILEGAAFIVSPAVNLPTIELCKRYSVSVITGALTPTEIVCAWTAGADCIKVFPASSMGGPSYIRSIKAPLPNIELMPMGGVSLALAEDYMKAGSWALGVGNDLVSARDLRESGARGVCKRAAEFRAKVVSARQSLASI